MKLSRVLGGAMALLALSSTSTIAQDRYATRPPVVVSPDLSAPWVIQLGNQPGRVVRRGSIQQLPEPERRVVRRKSLFGSIQVQPEYRRPVRRGVPAEGSFATAGIAPPVQKRVVQPTMDPIYLPREVDYPTKQKPGTIVIDTANKFLYFVRADGTARRYGIGVGKEGMSWKGSEIVSRKAEWPDWRPPAEMIARERKNGRELPAFMAGGIANPLGARALYLGDTLYRIHGTNAPWTIGTQASSGCIRLRNEDVVELYPMVKVGAKVVVM